VRLHGLSIEAGQYSIPGGVRIIEIAALLAHNQTGTAVTVTEEADLAPVTRWLEGDRATPLLIDAKVTRTEPAWWLEEAFRGH